MSPGGTLYIIRDFLEYLAQRYQNYLVSTVEQQNFLAIEKLYLFNLRISFLRHYLIRQFKGLYIDSAKECERPGTHTTVKQYLGYVRKGGSKSAFCIFFQYIPYSHEQKHISISDTPMLLIEINSISNMGCQK